jgi:hypothetical protein
LRQSVQKGWIEASEELVRDGTLFLFDDVTALGMSYPNSLVELLKENNQPTLLLDAQELARRLAPLLPVTNNLAVFEGGGMLSYLFLKKAGYQGELQGTVRVKREYQSGRPVCTLEDATDFTPDLFLDDILASGMTAVTVLQYYRGPKDFACLMASANIPKGVDGYRQRNQSTLPDVGTLYCGQFVNGLRGKDEATRKPAILSLRYLLTKAVDEDNYSTGYLAKKFGGQDKAVDICEQVKKVDREPIDLLRRDWKSFLKNYGVDKK